jgi:uncharacterized membrane protein
MRRSLLAAAVASAVSLSAHAGSFVPLATPNAKLTNLAQNGAYAGLSPNLRWIGATGTEEVIPDLGFSGNINNLGTLPGAVQQVDGNTTHDLPVLVALGATTPQMLPLPADAANADVYAVSDDGSAVGLTYSDDFTVARAYYWTVADGILTLPVTSTGSASRANVISADGHVIGGWNDDPDTGFRRGVVWVDRVATYVQDGSGTAVGEADGVSGNGQFVVGSSYPTTDGSDASWRLDVATGEVIAIPGMPFAFGVSDDGKMIVGAAGFFANPSRGLYIWTEAEGSQLFSDYLAARGIDVPAGWLLQGSLSGVSGDGSLVGGWSLTADGTRSFIVTGANGPIDKIFLDGFDPPPPPNPVQDGGFEATAEAGGANPFWDGSDTNPGAGGVTPFASGVPAHAGGFAVWFGGWYSGDAETQSVSQTVTMPSEGPLYLNYWRYAATVPDTAGTLVVTIDGTPVETTDLTTITDIDFTQASIDIGTYADGAAHVVQFTFDYPGGPVDGDLFIDDVSIDAVGAGGGPLSIGHRPATAWTPVRKRAH